MKTSTPAMANFSCTREIRLSKLFILLLFLLLSVTRAYAQLAITSFTPKIANVGNTVTITGAGFNTIAANNVVFFGATKATASTVTGTTELTVAVPVGASYDYITVLNTTTGRKGSSTQFFTPGFSPNKTTFNVADLAAKIDLGPITGPNNIATGDIDGDGKSDIIVSNSSGATVFLNSSTSGNITASDFTNAGTFAAVNVPNGLVLGDMNGDGKLDIIMTGNSAAITVLLNTSSTPGSVSFSQNNVATSVGESAISVADMDLDGMLDIIAIRTGTVFVNTIRNTSTPGAATVTFSGLASAVLPAAAGVSAFGDWDGDGKPDIITSNTSSNSISIIQNTSISGTISLGTVTTYTLGLLLRRLAIGDIDGDNKIDIVVVDRGVDNGTVVVLPNGSTGPGNFSAGTKVDIAIGSIPQGITVADMNGDGKVDIIAANAGGSTISVLNNKSTIGNVSIDASVDFTTGTGLPIVSDLDGDGKPDIVTINATTNTLSILRNTLMFAPTVQASDVVVSALTDQSATLSWTNGNGQKRAVFVKADNTGTPLPPDLTDYTGNAVFGSGTQIGSTGWYAVYVGTGTTENVTNLSPSTIYRVMVIDYNDNGHINANVPLYLTATATNNPVNLTTLVAVNSIARTTSAFTNASSVTYTVTFNGAVTGLSASNFSIGTSGAITGASITGITGSGTTYTVTVNTGSGDGTLILSLANATNVLPGITTTLPFTGEVYTIDKTIPTLNSVAIASNYSNTSRAKVGNIITLKFTASEVVSTPAVTIAGNPAIVTNTGGNDWSAVYTMTANDPDGLVAFNISFIDLAGNAGTAITTTSNSSSVIFDKTTPTLTSVTIASNYSNTSRAITGTVVMLNFTSS